LALVAFLVSAFELDSLFELVKRAGAERVGTDQTCPESASLIVHRELCTRCRLARALDADRHKHINLVFGRLVWLGAGIDERDELVEYSLLHDILFIRLAPARLFRLFQAALDLGLDTGSELGDELDVDVGFKEGGA
jgi:hypothetical protein